MTQRKFATQTWYPYIYCHGDQSQEHRSGDGVRRSVCVLHDCSTQGTTRTVTHRCTATTLQPFLAEAFPLICYVRNYR